MEKAVWLTTQSLMTPSDGVADLAAPWRKGCDGVTHALAVTTGVAAEHTHTIINNIFTVCRIHVQQANTRKPFVLDSSSYDNRRSVPCSDARHWSDSYEWSGEERENKNKNTKVYLFLGLSLFHKEYELRKKKAKNEICWENRDPRMRPM